ncbi:MAG: hypothetical protein IGS03_16040 [Candidatus Sericytochromatia bacterium]|nr:hypothetical protein [Candidatus Sericytochromatia bacterium]
MRQRILPLILALGLSACAANPLPNAPMGTLQRPAVVALNQSVAATAGPDSPPVRLQIRQAQIGLSTAELNKQFLSILALSEEERIREPVLRSLPPNQLGLSGRIKAARYLPEVSFSVTGTLQALPGNVIRFSPTDIRVIGIPFKQIMDILGLELANLAKFKDQWGRVVQNGNDIDLIIQKFTSDAIIEGQIRSVQAEAEGLLVVF